MNHTPTAAAGPSLVRFHGRLHRTLHWTDIFLMRPKPGEGDDDQILMVRKNSGAFTIAGYTVDQATDAELDRQELEAAWQVSTWMKPSLLHGDSRLDGDLIELADDLTVEVDDEV